MSRKWVALSIVGLIAISTLVACGPKQAPTTPDEVETTTAPPPEPVAPPPAPPVTEDAVETPWWENKDLRELNEEAARRGFHSNVYFNFDESDLLPEARQKLEENARFLKENPELKATVEGHCDERGTNEYNLALGDRRANNAKDFVVGVGVGAERLKTISYGEERPVCTESTESCWARNRRAYFVLSF